MQVLNFFSDYLLFFEFSKPTRDVCSDKAEIFINFLVKYVYIGNFEWDEMNLIFSWY